MYLGGGRDRRGLMYTGRSTNAGSWMFWGRESNGGCGGYVFRLTLGGLVGTSVDQCDIFCRLTVLAVIGSALHIRFASAAHS
jgi:hypothetical protein